MPASSMHRCYSHAAADLACANRAGSAPANAITTSTSVLLRCRHSALLCTRTKLSCCDSFYCGVRISLRSNKKDERHLTMPRVLSVEHKRRDLTGKIGGRNISRSAFHDDLSGIDNKRSGGRLHKYLREEGSGRDADLSSCLYLKRSVQNGELVEHSGSIVILGDVNPRGHVLADGDVVVLGRLQGHVHAGRVGDAKARIFATVMEPREIRICDSALFCPEKDGSNIPKMAVFSTEGHVTIHPAIGEVNAKLPMPQSVRGDEKHVESGSRSPSPTSKNGPMNEDGRVQSRRPSQVALVTGVYISIAGIALLGFPKVLFGILFDLEGVTLGWVQVGAILAVVLVLLSPIAILKGMQVFGVYYIGTAIGDLRGMKGAEAFYLSTVVGRVFLFLSFLWLVVTGAVPSPLLLVGAVNLLGALVMLRALLSPPSIIWKS